MLQEGLFPTTPTATKRGSRLPEDWKPSPAARAFAHSRGLDPEELAIAFRAHWLAKPTKNTSLDWSLNWQTWCLNAVRWKPAQKHNPYEKKDVSLPSKSEWGARLLRYTPGGFWLPQIWGPRPEEKGTWVPKSDLDIWKEGLKV